MTWKPAYTRFVVALVCVASFSILHVGPAATLVLSGLVVMIAVALRRKPVAQDVSS